MTAKYQNWLENGAYYTRTNGQKIFHHHLVGDGPDVLFLHGFPTSSYDWAGIFNNLRGSGRLISFDFLGFGASDKPRDHRYNYIEQADIAVEIASHYNIQSCILVAHDYGVTAAQELLKRQSNGSLNFRIEKVVLLNGGIYHHLHRPTLTQKLLLMPVLGPILARSFNRALFTKAFSKLFVGKFALSNHDADELWEGIATNSGQQISHKLLHYIADRKAYGRQWEKAMENCSIPMTLVWGLADPISGRHVIEYAKTRLKDARIIELADVSHYPQIEAPDLVSQAILDEITNERTSQR